MHYGVGIAQIVVFCTDYRFYRHLIVELLLYCYHKKEAHMSFFKKKWHLRTATQNVMAFKVKPLF